LCKIEEVKITNIGRHFLLFFSGMGYIVGAKMAELCGSWQWGLRATPVMGIVAVVLILLLLQDPPRGESEGHQHLKAQTYGVSN
jgi:hypothetical protein